MQISEQLKAFTAASHQQLEKRIVDHIRAISSISDYGALLNLFYGYFFGLEELAGPFISGTALPDFSSRRKVALLEKDLCLLDIPVEEFATELYLPPVQTIFQAFGVLYVMEGSTLGGIHIAEMIRRKLPQVSAALFFFTGYGKETLKKWEEFKYALNGLTKKQEEIDAILATAEETFQFFNKWIKYRNRKQELI